MERNDYTRPGRPPKAFRRGVAYLGVNSIHFMAAIMISTFSSLPGRYALRFESLFQPGRGMAFPCDERGRVVLDDLSERARDNYLYARAVVGREFAVPAVVPEFDD